MTQKPKGPTSDQAAYDLGYDNPTTPAREWSWVHLVFVNAFAAGQYDFHHKVPRNPKYDCRWRDEGVVVDWYRDFHKE